MVELVLVVAIILVLTAISLPTLTSVLAASKMRGAMGDLSGLYQNARNIAVKQNTISRVRILQTGGRWVAFVTQYPSLNNNLTQTEPQIYLPTELTKVSAPSGGAGAPTALDDAACGAASTSTVDTADDTYFSQMGIPCQYSGGVCSGGQPFAYYFNYPATSSQTNWAAMCVSPAGRIKAWYWTGSNWTN